VTREDHTTQSRDFHGEGPRVKSRQNLEAEKKTPSRAKFVGGLCVGTKRIYRKGV